MITILAAMTSCLSQKQRNKICNECPVRTDSIVTTTERIVLKDTTIFITDRLVSYRDTIFCDSLGIINMPKKIVKSNGLKATVQIKNNKVIVDCETDSLKLQIDYLLKEREILIKNSNTKTIQLPCNDERTKFDGFTYYWFIITFLLIAGYVIYKILKQRFNRFI